MEDPANVLSIREGWLPVLITYNDNRRIPKHPQNDSGLGNVLDLRVLYSSKSTKFYAARDHFTKPAVFLLLQMTYKQVLRFALY